MSDNHTLLALPRNTVNLIGSCQVITSVYSVVKELVENSLDAKASSVDIKLEDYGLERIEVCDNGCGAKVADVPFMAKRHFTSKIRCSEDLNFLSTYGFRGEALGSLCTVSNVTITTKTAEDQISFVYTIGLEGDVLDKKPSHAGKGTIVSARNLFHNVPVRKQYYGGSQRKKDDLRKIEYLLMAYSIVKPALRLTLKHEKDLVFQKTAMKDVKSTLHSVLGRQVANQMLYREKCVEELKLKVSAFLPKPGSDVKDMSLVAAEKTFVAVNCRPVCIPEINKILKNYYSNCHGLENYRHPVCFVALEVATNQIDVNVDPNKTKVFFQQKLEIQNTLEEILVEIYGTLDYVPSWHYTDANGNSEISKDSNEDHTKLKKPTRPVIVYSKYPGDAQSEDTENSDSNTENNMNGATVENESAVSNVTKLPSFSLTFHNKSSESEQAQSNSCADIAGVEISEIAPDSNLASDNSLERNNCCDSDNKESSSDAGSHVPVEFSGSELTEQNREQTEMDISTDNANLLDCNKTNTVFMNEDGISPVTDKLPNCELFIINDNKMSEPDTEKCMLISDKETLNETDKTSVVEDNVISHLDFGPDDWSKGNVTAGNTILQPVKLLSAFSEPVSGKKRPLSLSKGNESLSQPRKKAAKLIQILPPSQTTLDDLIKSHKIKKPDSPFTHYYEDKYPSLSQEFPDENEGAIKERLKKLWDNLNEDERVSYREKSWHDNKRYEKETVSAKQSEIRKTTAGTDKKMANECSRKKILKKRLYCKEKKIKIPINEIRNRDNQATHSNESSDPALIGPAYKCDDVWYCTLNDKLYAVNVWRLSEVALYKKLKSEHRLPFKQCDPVTLDSRVISERGLVVLENLARKSEGSGTFFHLTDERILGNGFDIKCHCDPDGNFTSELVGMCNTIPAYDVKDLTRILEIIHSNPDADLSRTRTLKASYFLQGEAVRMTRQNTSRKLCSDVQTLLNNAVGNMNQPCLHHKPIFQEIADFSDIEFDGD